MSSKVLLSYIKELQKPNHMCRLTLTHARTDKNNSANDTNLGMALHITMLLSSP